MVQASVSSGQAFHAALTYSLRSIFRTGFVRLGVLIHRRFPKWESQLTNILDSYWSTVEKTPPSGRLYYEAVAPVNNYSVVETLCCSFIKESQVLAVSSVALLQSRGSGLQGE